MSSEDSRKKIAGNVPRRQQAMKEIHDGREPFFPNFLLKEWIVGSIFLVGFMLWIVYNPVTLGAKADPTDTTFIPVPDWYFLFLYQLLKYFPGPDIIFPAVLIPTVAVLLLMFVPWLDRSHSRRPFRRPLATGGMVLAIFMMIWMTGEAYAQYQAEVNPSAAASSLPFPVQKPTNTALMATNMPGYAIFKTTCAACHGADLKGGIGPSLLGIGNEVTPATLLPVVKKGFAPLMPPAGGLSNPKDIQEVVAWVAAQKQK